MRRFSLFIFTSLFLTFSFEAQASSITATQSGDWNQTDTWGGSAVPDGTPCYDTIIIPAGITVTVTNTVNLTGCPSTIVFVDGDLIFQNGKKLNLSDGSVVWVAATGYIDVGSGGGSSTYITIDGDQYWNAADGPFVGPGVLCQNCSLPIELISFTAELIEGVVDLKWQTASEEENDYFVVQRSIDGFTWESIAVVDGAGNSSVLLSYEAEDRIPYLGLSYYRLKQVDMNGAFSFSDTRVISNGQFYSDQEMLIISQTSGSQSTFVIYFSEPLSGTLNLYITAVNGAIIYSETRETASEEWVVIHIDRPLSAGMYVVSANQKIDKTFAQ
ncbi:MAG: hypothetical protein IPM74_18620 [Crocinitomicaceae bacterium]|nr:hypothetical protein [Crocinitomicaceae bacterium]MBK8927856.1 hypothetical protein [Crocinitomicaceae bacterium]